MSKSYSAKVKSELPSELESTGMSLPSFSRQTGVPEATLYQWRKDVRLEAQSVSCDIIEVRKSEYYELQFGVITLRVPLTERAERLAELMTKLSC